MTTTQPAELVLALATSHMIASSSFLNWGFAIRAFVDLIFFLGVLITLIFGFLAPKSWMPFVTTRVTNVLPAITNQMSL